MTTQLPSESHMESRNIAFSPLVLGAITLKNRFIKAATYEGMYANGIPTQDLIDFHSRIARGGTALTTVAYGAVHPDGRTHEEQLLISEASVPILSELTKSVHQHGGLASIQLTHCGFFTRNKRMLSGSPMSASRAFNTYGLMSGLPFARAMSIAEIVEVTNDFARAAMQVKDAGFDALEVHMGHGYLLSQFLSPSINKRTDVYGASRSNRMRFPLEVFDAVRRSWPKDRPVAVRISATDWLDDGSGLTGDDAVEIARTLQAHACDLVDVSSAGNTPRSQPIYGRMYQVPFADRIRHEVGVPVMAVGAILGADHINTILTAGRADLCALARPHLTDPYLTLRAATEYEYFDQAWPAQYLPAKPGPKS